MRRSSSLSSIRRKNQAPARTALRQERLSPIADTVVKRSHKGTSREKDANTDTESSDDEVRSDENESDNESGSDSDSDELGAAGNTQEADMLRMITGDSDSDGLDEEPLDDCVALDDCY